MAQETIRYLKGNPILIESPTDLSDRNALVPISEQVEYGYTVVTKVMRLYDADKRTATTAAVPISTPSPIVLSVFSANNFAVGDWLEVPFADAAGNGIVRTLAEITAKDELNDTLTLDVATSSGDTIPSGRTVQVKLGGDVALIELSSAPNVYTDINNPVIWGWSGTVLASHTGLLPGMFVRLEADLATDTGLQEHIVRERVPVLEETA